MATINRAKLVNLMVEECYLGDKDSQRKAGGRFSTQDILSIYLVLKGVIEFGAKDKTMKFREILEDAELLANEAINRYE